MSKILEVAVKALDAKHATDIVAIDTTKTTPLYDVMVIATASNDRILDAIISEVKDECDKNDITIKSIQGKGSTWILIDLNEVVLQIFVGEERKNYNIEKLWASLDRVDIEAFLAKEVK